MQNKIIINKLRDNAELAQAAYGYFDLIGKKFHIKSKTRKDDFITQTDILDITYNKYIAVKLNPHNQNDEIKVGTLKGEFNPTQAQRFFERYDLLLHQPNTSSGFSASLFQEKESKEFIFSFRGTEMGSDKIKAMLH